MHQYTGSFIRRIIILISEMLRIDATIIRSQHNHHNWWEYVYDGNLALRSIILKMITTNQSIQMVFILYILYIF